MIFVPTSTAAEIKANKAGAIFAFELPSPNGDAQLP
jgi:hypothetical protein